ncbi:MAG TPA: response regulator [Bacteroidales bacterium]|nr:response regulator [Bacteroidales bacterium]
MNDRLVFVVDDDPFITALVAGRLGAEGFRVRTFSYGEECLASLRENPDLIILDYYFVRDSEHQMNGMAVFDEILRIMPGVKVIMLSAQEKGDVVLELARKGISDYVIKDTSLMDNLLVSVREIFE